MKPRRDSTRVALRRLGACDDAIARWRGRRPATAWTEAGDHDRWYVLDVLGVPGAELCYPGGPPCWPCTPRERWPTWRTVRAVYRRRFKRDLA